MALYCSAQPLPVLSAGLSVPPERIEPVWLSMSTFCRQTSCSGWSLPPLQSPLAGGLGARSSETTIWSIWPTFSSRVIRRRRSLTRPKSLSRSRPGFRPGLVAREPSACGHACGPQTQRLGATSPGGSVTTWRVVRTSERSPWSQEPAVALDERELRPELAQPPGAARRQHGDRDHGERVDDVVVDDRVARRAQRAIRGVLGQRPLRRPHEQHHRGATGGRDPQRDPEGQRHADAEQAEHEQPVRPRGPRPAVERRLQRARGDMAEEALGRGAAVDPGPRRRGRVAEPEGLVQEGPQEHEPDRHAEDREEPRRVGRQDRPMRRRRCGSAPGGDLYRYGAVQPNRLLLPDGHGFLLGCCCCYRFLFLLPGQRYLSGLMPTLARGR